MKFQISLVGVEEEFKKLYTSEKEERKLKSDIQVANMLGDLVEATPIDTGQARASWNVDKRDDIYNVKNDVEYIQYLNEGSSKQAPSHFIETIALQYGKPLGTIVEVKS